ncbi:DUF4397 domain-containing protein [Olivibacter sp. SDN3]|uniref:DUF4397 domain-containing protein n=1 Tax=Olivibacter sp. SDN3 TaxID=2764720 RepID=UPI001651A2FB|nr:DUF4397 domain-containing protein [Olivibacter sp. SDN3]QNL51229.1 DUF4397 domain-containing protein [Olivibacter sp. SDN3]
MNIKNYLVLLVTMLTGGLAFQACNTDSDPVYMPTAYVNFVNAYAGADALGIMLDNNNINTATGGQPLEYGKYIGYLPAYPGSRLLSAGIPGTNTTVVDSTITLEDSTFYTSFFYGHQDTVSSILVADKTPEDYDQSNAYVRFFHLSENTPEVNVNLINSGTPTEVFSNRAIDDQASAEANADFTAVDEGSYTIQVTDTDGTELALRDEVIALNAGKYYTILTRGIIDTTQTPLVVGVFQHQ